MEGVTEPEVYMERIGEILGDGFVDGKFQPVLNVSSVDEAILKNEKFAQQQGQLSQIKGEIDQNIEYIDTGYKEAEENVKPSNPGGFFAGLARRREKDVKQQRQNLSHGEEIALEPFYEIRQTVDDLLKQLDNAKSTLNDYIENNQ